MADGGAGTRGPAQHHNLWSERLAEESFRRLFTSAEITSPGHVNDYLAAFSEQHIYNIRSLLVRVAGLESEAEVRDTLRQLGVRRGLHADRLCTMLFGSYTAVEEELVEKEIIREADLSSDWTQLLTSLDILPDTTDIAAQVFDATGESLPSMLQYLQTRHGVWEECVRDDVMQVPVFRDTPRLIEVLDAAIASVVAPVRSCIFDSVSNF